MDSVEMIEAKRRRSVSPGPHKSIRRSNLEACMENRSVLTQHELYDDSLEEQRIKERIGTTNNAENVIPTSFQVQVEQPTTKLNEDKTKSALKTTVMLIDSYQVSPVGRRGPKRAFLLSEATPDCKEKAKLPTQIEEKAVSLHHSVATEILDVTIMTASRISNSTSDASCMVADGPKLNKFLNEGEKRKAEDSVIEEKERDNAARQEIKDLIGLNVIDVPSSEPILGQVLSSQSVRSTEGVNDVNDDNNCHPFALPTNSGVDVEDEAEKLAAIRNYSNRNQKGMFVSVTTNEIIEVHGGVPGVEFEFEEAQTKAEEKQWVSRGPPGNLAFGGCLNTSMPLVGGDVIFEPKKYSTLNANEVVADDHFIFEAEPLRKASVNFNNGQDVTPEDKPQESVSEEYRNWRRAAAVITSHADNVGNLADSTPVNNMISGAHWGDVMSLVRHNAEHSYAKSTDTLKSGNVEQGNLSSIVWDVNPPPESNEGEDYDDEINFEPEPGPEKNIVLSGTERELKALINWFF